MDDVGLHISMEPYPHDVRCGCPICPDCRKGVPCELCHGDCLVCRGLVPPGPTELTKPVAACTVAGCVVHDEAAAARRARRREAELQRAERQRPTQSAEVYHAVVPEGVTTLEAGYFRGRRDLQSVALPASLTRIGDGAFEDFHSLMLRELPASLTSIGDLAFKGCSSLALRELPASLMLIGDRAFYGCSSLALRELPASLLSIGNHAFYGCTSSLALRELLFSFEEAEGRGFRRGPAGIHAIVILLSCWFVLIVAAAPSSISCVFGSLALFWLSDITW